MYLVIQNACGGDALLGTGTSPLIYCCNELLIVASIHFDVFDLSELEVVMYLFIRLRR